MAQSGGRDWTPKLVQRVIDRAVHRSPAINRATGNQATSYFERTGAHVIRDDVTGEIVQVSSRLNPGAWKPDASIVKSIRAMTNAHDIDVEFNDRVLLRWGLRLFAPTDAIALIRKCRDAGVRVLGIDAFLDHPDGVQPMFEHSIDFSREGNTELLKDSWRQAEGFVLERAATSFLFEVVLDRPI